MVAGKEISSVVSSIIKTCKVPAFFSVDTINELIKKYPYDQSLHLIKAFLLKGDNDKEYKKELTSLATHVLCRERLYDLDKGDWQLGVQEEKIEKSKEVLSSLGGKNLVEEVKVENVRKEEDSEVIETNEEKDKITSIKTELPSKENSTTEQIEDEIKVVESIITERKDLSFTEWLKVQKQVKEDNNSEENIVDIKKSEDIPFDKVSPIEVEMMLESKKASNDLQDFLQKQKVKKIKKKDAKNEIVSETLAKILAMQGKYDTAEEIYNKLIQKYPEKSRYFADQISKLKNS